MFFVYDDNQYSLEPAQSVSWDQINKKPHYRQGDAWRDINRAIEELRRHDKAVVAEWYRIYRRK
jgi:hypothetical protein